MGRPDYIFGQFREFEKPCDAAMSNTGAGFVVLSGYSLFIQKKRSLIKVLRNDVI